MFERYSERGRRVVFMALWSARRRGGSYIEPEDLLNVLIREDRGEFPAISAEIFPAGAGEAPRTDTRHPFFPDDVAASLLRALREDTERVTIARGDQLKPTPQGDMPVSLSLREVLEFVAKTHESDAKTIEPLDLLLGILENRDPRLALMLQGHHITRQLVVEALE